MLKSYFKTAIRNLIRNKAYAVINVFGLAIGVAGCLLISMFVKDELTYDSWHRNKENIYRITTVSTFQDKQNVMQATSYVEANIFKQQIPEIKSFARLRGEGATVNIGSDYFDEKRLKFADRALFEIFDFKLIQGAFDEQLDGLESVLLTASASVKYFGNTASVGKVLRVDVGKGFEDFIVNAVIEDHPSNSSFSFDMIMSWPKLESIKDKWSMNLWVITPAVSYVLLDEKADIPAVIDKMQAIRIAQNPGDENSMEARARSNSNGLLPLKDIHFDGSRGKNSISQSYILSGIAILIVIIACFNFANLTFANSINRAKEVGVRKTVGADKKQLVTQFLFEALIICCFAFVVGIILAELALPTFESIIEKEFNRGLIQDKAILAMCFLSVLFASVLSVMYPSVFLSRLKVSRVFRGGVSVGNRRLLTKSLVTFQFLVAITFIIVTVGINKQHNYLMDKDKGYNDENLIKLRIPQGNSKLNFDRLKNELIQNPNVRSIGAVGELNEGINIAGPGGEASMVIMSNADPDYIKTLEIELSEGRSFDRNDVVKPNENEPSVAVIVNRSVVEALGLEAPIGKTLDEGKYRIVGLIEDYQLFSAKSVMNSVMLTAESHPGRRYLTNNVFIKYQEGKLSEVLPDIESAWKRILPYTPFSVTYVDTYNQNLYKKEAVWAKTLNYSSMLAIAVAIMGLLGLVSFSTAQRRREISIRKVLGAPATHLLLLLNQGFTILLALSIVISLPISYYIIQSFLDDYINRIEITFWLFALPIGATFLIAWMTVSSITIRSVVRNPIIDLHHE